MDSPLSEPYKNIDSMGQSSEHANGQCKVGTYTDLHDVHAPILVVMVVEKVPNRSGDAAIWCDEPRRFNVYDTAGARKVAVTGYPSTVHSMGG